MNAARAAFKITSLIIGKGPFTKRSLLIYKEGLLLDIDITTETTAVFILNMSAFKVGAPQSSFAVLLFKMI